MQPFPILVSCYIFPILNIILVILPHFISIHLILRYWQYFPIACANYFNFRLLYLFTIELYFYIHFATLGRKQHNFPKQQKLIIEFLSLYYSIIVYRLQLTIKDIYDFLMCLYCIPVLRMVVVKQIRNHTVILYNCRDHYWPQPLFILSNLIRVIRSVHSLSTLLFYNYFFVQTPISKKL